MIWEDNIFIYRILYSMSYGEFGFKKVDDIRKHILVGEKANFGGKNCVAFRFVV